MLLRETPFPLPIIHPCSLSLIEASILCIDTDIESDSHSIQGGSNTFKPISSDENHPLIYIYIYLETVRRKKATMEAAENSGMLGSDAPCCRDCLPISFLQQMFTKPLLLHRVSAVGGAWGRNRKHTLLPKNSNSDSFSVCLMLKLTCSVR